MAEALANQLGDGKVQAFSAGTRPLGVISRDTRAVLLEKGIALEGHWSKGLQDVPIAEMDVVVEMGYGVEFSPPEDFKGRLVRWQIPDPYSLDQDHFRDVRDLIEREVQKLLLELAPASGESRNSENGNGNSIEETREAEIEGGERARKCG
jgi:protein-tyrosine-phosphatase